MWKALLLFIAALALLMDWMIYCVNPQTLEAHRIGCNTIKDEYSCEWLDKNGYDRDGDNDVDINIGESCQESYVIGQVLAWFTTKGKEGTPPGG